MIWMALLSCLSPSEPAITPEAQAELEVLVAAVEAWEQGEQALRADDADVAEQMFSRAMSFRPNDPLLMAWHARARHAQGDGAGARAELEHVIRMAPELTAARLELAKLYVSEGALEQGAAQLETVVAQHPEWVADLRTDPVLNPWLTSPTLSFLRAPVPIGSLNVTEGPVFAGSSIRVHMTLSHVPTLDWALRGTWAGPARVVRVVHASHPDHDTQEVDIELLVMGTGTVVWNQPGIVWDGGELELDAVTVETRGEGGPGAPDASDMWTVMLPRVLLDAHPVPDIWEEDGRLWASYSAEHQVVAGPSRVPLHVHLEYREGDVTRMVHAWAHGLRTLEILASGKTLVRKEGQPH
ncbi:MAG: tetratricopeptide repeat protein [Myxococcota bacterium]